MKILRFLIIALAINLGGCKLFEPAYNLFIPDDAQPALEAVRALVLEDDIDGMTAYWHPSIDVSQVPGVMTQIAELRPATPLRDITLVGAQRHTSTSNLGGSISRVSAVYEARWAEQSFGLVVQLASSGESPWQVISFNFIPIDPAIAGPTRLADWGTTRMLWVGLAAANLAFILITLVSLYRIRRVKRRIIWTLLIIGGCFPVFAMDWSTASLWLESPALHTEANMTRLSLFELRFFGAAFSRPDLLAPWLLDIALPLGALFFWYRVLRGGPTRRDHIERRPR